MDTIVKFGLAASLVLSSVAFAAELAPRQQSFATPQAAVKALIEGSQKDDTKALAQILGADAKPLLESGDAVDDRLARQRFVKAYEAANTLQKSGDNKYMLEVGKDHWPFPIPLVKEAAGWRFDTSAGKEELLNRRIGRHELETIQTLLAYVDAQREYYLANPQHEKLFSYAQKFRSSPNKRDGLYYPVKPGEPPSPLGELFAGAEAAGYGQSGSSLPVYHGYHYRILTAQGQNASGGAYDYMIHGKLLGGHALIAWPATYGNTGVMTFMVNHDGVVYEKDLGLHTNDVVQKFKTFNPDKTWKKSDLKQ